MQLSQPRSHAQGVSVGPLASRELSSRKEAGHLKIVSLVAAGRVLYEVPKMEGQRIMG